MKKLLLLTVCALMSMVGMAQTKTYTDNLVVTINDESTEPQPTGILFTDNGDGTCDFALNNFCLGAGEDFMGVGNIALKGLLLTKMTTYSQFEFVGSLFISEGDDPSVDMWLGPMLGEIPLVLKGEVNDDQLYVTIDIDMMESIGQIIYVKFGTDNVGYTPFTDNLVVTVNEESTEPQSTTVYFRENGNGTCDFNLNNFVLGAGEDMMGVGNITVRDLLYEAGTPATFSFDGALQIANGDSPEVDTWIGPLLGEIPLKLTGKVLGEKIYVNIDIDMMESIGQVIHVDFGDNNFIIPPTTYDLTFVIDGDTVSVSQLEEGEVITYPEATPKEGHTFAWENLGLTNMPAEAVTINGAYTPNTYSVTYVDGEEVIATFEVVYGEELPEAPTYTPSSDDRYTRTFVEWAGDTYTTMPAHDVVYTAVVDVVDGISAISADNTAVVYDLQGRRVKKAVRGLYIINDKKILK